MTTELLFDCIGNISDTYIKEADEAAALRRTPPFRMWRPALAAAACIVVVAATLTGLYTQQKGPETNDSYGLSAGMEGAADSLSPNSETAMHISDALDTSSEADNKAAATLNGLPLLSAELNVSGGMGFEGYMAYSSDELTNANPWTEDAAFTTLPVYQNTISYYPSGAAVSPDLEEMRATAITIAQKLNIPEKELTITDDSAAEDDVEAMREKLLLSGMDPDSEEFKETLQSNTQAGRIIAEDGNMRIEVDSSQTAYVEFASPIPLAKGLSLAYYSPLTAVQAVGQYLLTQPTVTSLLERPVLNIHDGSYDIYANQSYYVTYFEEGNSAEEQLLNYNFNTLDLYDSEDGSVNALRLWHHDLSKKLGDYPIIDSAQAQELLLNGNYITTVPEKMPGEEYIRDVELIYRNSILDETWMPYYRFYVELPDEKMDNGLNTYGAYYVPAVASEYLVSLPVWDGRFN